MALSPDLRDLSALGGTSASEIRGGVSCRVDAVEYRWVMYNTLCVAASRKRSYPQQIEISCPRGEKNEFRRR